MQMVLDNLVHFWNKYHLNFQKMKSFINEKPLKLNFLIGKLKMISCQHLNVASINRMRIEAQFHWLCYIL